MGAVVEIWFESLIPFLLKDSHIVQCNGTYFSDEKSFFKIFCNLFKWSNQGGEIEMKNFLVKSFKIGRTRPKSSNGHILMVE